MDDQWKMALKFGAVLVVLVGMSVGAVLTFSQGSIIGDDNQNQTEQPGTSQDTVAWSTSDNEGAKEGIGLKFPTQTASESVVMIPTNDDGSVDAANYGSADVTSVGADADEEDQTELFASEDAEEGEDYYQYSTFDSQITSNLPDSGTYKVAVIGSGVANDYSEYTIKDEYPLYKLENSLPVQPLSDSAVSYAADADITTENTVVEDGSTTVALSNDFSSEDDSNVDGTVTGIRSYSVADDKIAQFGEVSISSVNDSVNEVAVTVSIDGEEVFSQTDTDFSDNEGLDDGVEFPDESSFENAEETVTVETAIDFEDSEMSSAGDLVTVGLDDKDADGDSSDGDYGISELSTTWTGY